MVSTPKPSHPLGEFTADGQVALSPAGQEKYRQEQLRLMHAWGPSPFGGDPRFDPPPIIPGGPNFNPFLGTWIE